MTPMMRAADVARYMGGAVDRGRGGFGQAGAGGESGEGMMMDETWPEPRPIAEADPKAEWVLVWKPGLARWMSAEYDDATGPPAWITNESGRVVSPESLFIPMPPVPKVTP